MYAALTFLLAIFIHVLNKQMFCYERDFLLSLSEDTLSKVTEAFNSTSRYLDDISSFIAWSIKFTRTSVKVVIITDLGQRRNSA